MVRNDMAWLAGWSKRIKIDIDYTNKIGAPVTHFPVTIFLKAENGETAKVFDEVGENKQKIAITKSDGITQLYAEIERWDETNQLAEIHISKSDWVIDADTSVYLYYDNTHADNVDYIGITPGSAPATNVWNANYVGIWHLRESGNGIDDEFKDSTPNANHGTGGGVAGSGNGAKTPDQIDAKIGKGQDFELGNADGIYVADADNLSALTNITLEAWVNPESNPAVAMVLAKCLSGGDEFSLDVRSGVVTMWVNTGSWANANSGAIKLSIGTWYHIAGRYDGSVIKVYINGVEKGTADWSGNIANLTAPVGIGVKPDGVASFDGIIDEARISNTPRAITWINASYNSGNDSLLSYGNEEIPVISEKDIELSGVYTWRIERKVDGGEWQVLEEAIQIGSVEGEFIYDDESGLEHGRTYCYRVKNVTDNGLWSNEDCVVFIGEIEVNSEKEIELRGINEAQNERVIELIGRLGITRERAIELSGIQRLPSERAFELLPTGSDVSEKQIELHGIETTENERQIELRGTLKAQNERGIELSGLSEVSDERQIESRGCLAESSERAFELGGKITSESERGIELWGKIKSESERGFMLKGRLKGVDERTLELEGWQPFISERGFEMRVIARDPYCPKDSPYSKKPSPYAGKDSPFSKKESPYSLKVSPFNKLKPAICH